MPKRHKIGIALMVKSFVLALLIQLSGGGLFDLRSGREDRFASGVLVSDAMINVHWISAAPFLVVFAGGMICCIWPRRRPATFFHEEGV
jgi:hypothetical protein